ncbi:hypothetical protein [Mycobacterium dioxanotrophicus]|jgi:hypothetical protein|uniref:hypothetical protein n=1 Tax=Mycobacterium dioxanotrophicus TaxID=482462 RepID=UPI001E5DD529|nr:hypothetical protein [Mycobacterium dioxanotrophicus]
MADHDRFDDDTDDWGGSPDDGLGAFDFSTPDAAADDDAGLDSFDGFGSNDHGAPSDDSGEDDDFDVLYADAAASEHDTDSDLAAFHDPVPETGEEEQDTLFPLFVVTNPPGTVSVTAAISGQLQQIQLSAQASKMTESELGHEIQRTAAVAIKKAQAGLNYFVYSTLVKQGMDHSSARNFVEFGMHLPNIEQAKEAEADFVAQYRRE